METWEKVTTRSRVSIYRTNDPMETIAAIALNLTKMTVIPIYEKKKTICPVTVLVDSQVSDRCPWATCFSYLNTKIWRWFELRSGFWFLYTTAFLWRTRNLFPAKIRLRLENEIKPGAIIAIS